MPIARTSTGNSGSEDKFIELFCDTFGAEKGQYVYLQYPMVDIYGGHRSIDFALQTPAKWADDAWAKLKAAVNIPHPNGWSAEERRDLVNTYARMAMMRELAKDPEKAGLIAGEGEYGWDGWLGPYFCNDPESRTTFLMLTQRVDYATGITTRKLRNIVFA